MSSKIEVQAYPDTIVGVPLGTHIEYKRSTKVTLKFRLSHSSQIGPCTVNVNMMSPITKVERVLLSAVIWDSPSFSRCEQPLNIVA